MAELTTKHIKQFKNLSQIPDLSPSDLLLLQDVSDQNEPYKKATALSVAQTIIDDTTASTSKVYSSDFITNNLFFGKMGSLFFNRSYDALGVTFENVQNGFTEMLLNTDGSTANMPNGVYAAIKQQLLYDVNNIIVKLVDINTFNIYYNRYIRDMGWQGWRKTITASDKLASNRTVLTSNTVVIRSYSISELFNQNHVNITFSLLANLQPNESITIGTLNVLPSREFQFAIPFLAGNQIGLGYIHTDGVITLSNYTTQVFETWNTGSINITYITA